MTRTEYVYYRPRRGFTPRLVFLVRELTRKKCNSFLDPLTSPDNRLYYSMIKNEHNTNVRFTTGRYEVREHPDGGWMVWDTDTNTIEQEFDFKFSAQNLTDILNTQENSK